MSADHKFITDPKSGFDQHKESVDDDTIDIDVELYGRSTVLGETENKDIVNQDESFMNIDSAECGLEEPAWSNRIC